MKPAPPKANGFRIQLMCVPDSARSSGDATSVFRASATISDAFLDWMRCASSDGSSAKRTGSVIQGLLLAMRTQKWDPYHAVSLANPLRFNVAIDGVPLAIIASVNTSGRDLLHLDIASSDCNN